MLIRRPADILPSEITPHSIFLDRRRFIRDAGLALAAGAALYAGLPASARASSLPRSPYSTEEALTGREAILTYNNFYEFGTGKDDPAKNAGKMSPAPGR